MTLITRPVHSRFYLTITAQDLHQSRQTGMVPLEIALCRRFNRVERCDGGCNCYYLDKDDLIEWYPSKEAVKFKRVPRSAMLKPRRVQFHALDRREYGHGPCTQFHKRTFLSLPTPRPTYPLSGATWGMWNLVATGRPNLWVRDPYYWFDLGCIHSDADVRFWLMHAGEKPWANRSDLEAAFNAIISGWNRKESLAAHVRREAQRARAGR